MKNKRNIIVYLSGKYTAPTHKEIVENIQIAREYAIKIWESGYTCLSPIANTSHYELDCKCFYVDYISGDLELIKRCDVMFMLPNWKESGGAIIEHNKAMSLGKPIIRTIKELDQWYGYKRS